MKTKQTENELNEKITKLPAWAQKHIENLTRQRDNALSAQQKYLDEQTESPFFVEFDGADNRSKRFIQAHHMTVTWKGVQLRVDAHDFSNSGKGIRLQWQGTDHREVALIPEFYQGARLVSISEMR